MTKFVRHNKQDFFALAAAYPTPTRPAALNADEGVLLAAASQLKLATSR